MRVGGGEGARAFLLLLLLAGLHARKPYSYQFVRRDFQPYDYQDEADRWMCLVFGLCAISPSFGAKSDLALVYQWSKLEFAYASPQDRQAAISSGAFIPGVPAPIDVDVDNRYETTKRSRIFTTIPRFQAGIPATLGIIVDSQNNQNPRIAPYPSWSWHENPEFCKRDRLVSVYRIFIDECQRLWVLDTGKLLENQTCPPQILAFDLKTDQLIHRYEIPKDQIEPRSILVTPVIDIRDTHGQCANTFVYVADCQTYSIIVYDVQNDISWRVTDKTMYPYPNYGTYEIQGDRFDLMDGILGMALEPYRPGHDRKLFYHAMSSPTENWVFTSHLRNRTRFLHSAESSPEIFNTFRGQRRTQSAAEAISKEGIMFFGLMTDVTIDCWNINTEYGPQTMDVVARNRKTLQFASGVKVITNRKGIQELWVLTSRFQKIGAGTLDSNEVNFRIQAETVDNLISGTKCKNNFGWPSGGFGFGKPGKSNN